MYAQKSVHPGRAEPRERGGGGARAGGAARQAPNGPGRRAGPVAQGDGKGVRGPWSNSSQLGSPFWESSPEVRASPSQALGPRRRRVQGHRPQSVCLSSLCHYWTLAPREVPLPEGSLRPGAARPAPAGSGDPGGAAWGWRLASGRGAGHSSPGGSRFPGSGAAFTAPGGAELCAIVFSCPEEDSFCPSECRLRIKQLAPSLSRACRIGYSGVPCRQMPGKVAAHPDSLRGGRVPQSRQRGLGRALAVGEVHGSSGCAGCKQGSVFLGGWEVC